MVYCLWSTAAIISADSITTTTKKVGFGVYLFYFFFKKRGEGEREKCFGNYFYSGRFFTACLIWFPDSVLF